MNTSTSNVIVLKLGFITIVELDKMVTCDTNRKILEELIDTTTVKPLEPKPPLPISVILQNGKYFKK